MAFKSKNVGIMSTVWPFTQWIYQTDDSKDEVLSENYFDSLYSMVAKGDIIVIIANGETIIRYVKEVGTDYVDLGKIDM